MDLPEGVSAVQFDYPLQDLVTKNTQKLLQTISEGLTSLESPAMKYQKMM